ncbi:MAG: hypothetical protein JST80_01180 [Bdellovibrionales bacterium]|nr:hypothetical protein [Bdellovibrionales bacterium]
MNKFILILGALAVSASSFAQSNSDFYNVNVTDVTQQRLSSILPIINGSGGGGQGCLPTDPWCGELPPPVNPGYGSGGGNFNLGTLLTFGQKVLDFILNNKPNAEYKTLRAAVLPEGMTNWSQLKGWAKPVAKVYKVEFKNLLGKSAGGFEYRIVFIHGGSYQGKGKFIGQISFAPMNVNLKTDRTLKLQAELLDPLNFGSEDDPIAGVQLLITWSSPTTMRYNMNSIEYFMYGTGEIEDISNGTP